MATVPSLKVKKFLEWRNRAVQQPTQAEPVKKFYEHTGWLSSEETRKERMARLTEAVAKNLELHPNDFAWFSQEASINFRRVNCWDKGVIKGFYKMESYVGKFSRPVLGGR